MSANEASDLEAAISDEEESISSSKAEIEALDDGLRALDKEVEVATATPKEEHNDFTASSAANATAVDLLKFTQNRLNKREHPWSQKRFDISITSMCHTIVVWFCFVAAV